jgi:hypothetical protein
VAASSAPASSSSPPGSGSAKRPLPQRDTSRSKHVCNGQWPCVRLCHAGRFARTSEGKISRQNFGKSRAETTSARFATGFSLPATPAGPRREHVLGPRGRLLLPSGRRRRPFREHDNARHQGPSRSSRSPRAGPRGPRTQRAFAASCAVRASKTARRVPIGRSLASPGPSLSGREIAISAYRLLTAPKFGLKPTVRTISQSIDSDW